MIFAAIAIAWLAYLVPHFARRRGDEVVTDRGPAERFSDSVRIVKHGTAPLLDQDLEPIEEFEVSTPLTRRAAIAELRRLDRVAATRRRRVLLGLLAVISALVGVCAMGWLPWWSLAVPGGLLVAFFVVSRFSVRAVRKNLDARYREIVAGGHEKTVFLTRKDVVKAAAEPRGAAKTAKPEGRAVAGSLWDPIPITKPTYVSKPLAPRTVRTIDLSGPGLISSPHPSLPVIADAPARAEAGPDEREAGGDEHRAASA